MFSDELISTVALSYCLDEAILKRIEIYTSTFIGDNGNKKDVKLDNMSNILVQQIRLDMDKGLPQVIITTGNVNIRIQYRAGDTVTRDTSCNSEYTTTSIA